MTDATFPAPAGPNLSLPPIPAWRTKSFWLQLLSFLVLIGTAAGIDVIGIFRGLGLGDSPEAVVQTGERAYAAWQVLMGMALNAAAYGQRQAPNFRVVWRWVPGAPKGIR